MINSIIRGVNKFMHTTAYDYCCIEANSESDPCTLITKDSGMMTIFEVVGVSNIIGKRQFTNRIAKIIQGFNNNASEVGHRIEWTFTRNPDLSKDVIAENITKLKGTSSRLNMGLDFLYDEKQSVLSDKVSFEKCYLVLTTSPLCLPKSEVKRNFEKRAKRAVNNKTTVKPGAFGMSPYFELEGMSHTHEAFISSIQTELKECTEVTKLTAHEAIKAIRIEAMPDVTSPDWKPQLLGDKITPRFIKEIPNELDVSHVLNLPIAYQLFPSFPEEIAGDATLVRAGGRVYAPLTVDFLDGSYNDFNSLFKKIPDNIPWRWSFQMHTGHNEILGKLKTKKAYATWLSLTNSRNKLIKSAAEELIAFGEVAGEKLCVGQMVIVTWGATEEEARTNKSYLMRAMQSWGAEVIEERGDSVEVFMNSLPAISSKYAATQLPLIIKDALGMAPMFRPASPWKYGNQLFRTKDRKLFPYLTGSSKQENWVSNYFAPPGKGKSFLMCSENMAHLNRPGNVIIPRISILDIGYSSAAFVEIVKNALPHDKRYLAEAYTLQNTREYAINPFDVPLGCYRPLPVDRESIVNFVITLLTPAGLESPPPMMSEIVGLLVTAMYDHFSPEGEPFKYEFGEDDEVDEAIKNHSLHVTEDFTSWFEVRDMLFERKDYVNATRAQRFAVPTIEDAATVLKENHSLRAKFVGASGEELLNTITTMIQSAISEFPVMSNRTKFDIGNARIVSLNLQDVCPSSSAKADKQTGLMYLLGRMAICGDFYRSLDNIPDFPEACREYHRRLIEAESQSPKKLCLDEIHRTRRCPMVRVQILQDAREGRKHDVILTLASQFIEDFDNEMLDIANNTYILAVNTESAMAEIKKRYNPSADTIDAIRAQLRGPTSEGSDFLYIGKAKGREQIEMILLLTVGPVEGWGYSTTKQDVLLRQELVSKVGLRDALSILSSKFPGMTAVDYIQSRRESDGLQEGDNIHKIIANELIQEYKELITSN